MQGSFTATLSRRAAALAVGLGILGTTVGAYARPANIFTPYLAQIRQGLPPNYQMRLPAEILLGGPGLDADELNQVIIKVLSTDSPPRMTVGLFTCESNPFPCLIGGFSVEGANSANAQHELSRHEEMATPITLTRGVRGYLRDGTKLNPPSEFSSLMWEQDGMIYTISFLAAERQNILYMAQSMANQPPLESTYVATPAR
jgi:hypothetical protein